ncbi:hypothetical protein [Hydrogenophaga sp. ZJX-1]|uniref:hypothetical protein n=1 Tax=Hydrogenophaga sp. ZJX-1 TaxID=3404778 RepID=UPI003B27DAC8
MFATLYTCYYFAVAAMECRILRDGASRLTETLAAVSLNSGDSVTGHLIAGAAEDRSTSDTGYSATRKLGPYLADRFLIVNQGVLPRRLSKSAFPRAKWTDAMLRSKCQTWLLHMSWHTEQFDILMVNVKDHTQLQWAKSLIAQGKVGPPAEILEKGQNP